MKRTILISMTVAIVIIMMSIYVNVAYCYTLSNICSALIGITYIVTLAYFLTANEERAGRAVVLAITIILSLIIGGVIAAERHSAYTDNIHKVELAALLYKENPEDSNYDDLAAIMAADLELHYKSDKSGYKTYIEKYYINNPKINGLFNKYDFDGLCTIGGTPIEEFYNILNSNK